jgi:hypothetical protein
MDEARRAAQRRKFGERFAFSPRLVHSPKSIDRIGDCAGPGFFSLARCGFLIYGLNGAKSILKK